MRLLSARLFQETNALSPVPTDDAAFRRFWDEGASLAARCRWAATEVPGVWWNAELTGFQREAARLGATPTPLFSALAIPGGKVERSVYEGYKDRLIDQLVAGRPDGVYLALHGAMGVTGLDDADGDLLGAVRAALPGVPLVASFDLHGFLTPARVAAADLLLAYRTYPHRDQQRVGAEAARLLVRLARREIRPTIGWRSLPMVLGGAPSVDFLSPMRGVFRALDRVRGQPGVLTASITTCQPWHDAPMLGWSTYVATDGDPSRADALAESLADTAWAVRDHLPPELPAVDAAVDRALSATVRRRFGTVCLSDCSDAVGAGGVGENTAVLAELLGRGSSLRAFVPVRDAPAVDALWDTPIGRRVAVEVGGKLAPEWYRALPLEGELTWRGRTTLGGRVVRIRAGRTEVVVTADAPVAIGPRFYREVDLSPWAADVCVVKSWVAFRFHYLPYNRLSLWAKTRGVTDLHAMEGIVYDGPMWPFTRLADWRGADRRRRC
ncbi:MAG: M81 family metallopeptidase [Myxococcota bacterium]